MGEIEARALSVEDLAVGDVVERAFEVKEADITAFAAVSHDNNPLHLDEAFAAGTPFKGRIAHGMLSAAYISAVLGNDLPGPGGVYLSQTLAFKRPVRIGDTVVVEVRVTDVEADQGRATLSTVCRIGRKTVLDGVAVVMVPRRAAAGAG